MTVRHIQHPATLKALLQSPTGGVAKDLFRRGKKIETRAKLNLEKDPRRIDTGNLRSSIHTTLFTVNSAPAVQVGTNVEYAPYVHNGTGIYGPHGTPIVPVSAKVLRWKSKGGAWVFRPYVLGMKPNPFLADAIEAAKD